MSSDQRPPSRTLDPEWERHRVNLVARDRGVREVASYLGARQCFHEARCKCFERARLDAFAVLNALVQAGWTLTPPGDLPSESGASRSTPDNEGNHQ